MMSSTGKLGMVRNILVMTCSTLSTHPPASPEMSPITVPMTTVNTAVSSAMPSTLEEPATIMRNTSLPMLSVPSGCSHEMPAKRAS